MKKGIKPRPRIHVELRGKAVWCWETTVVENGSENIVDVCKSLGIKHLFILVKGTSGTIVKETIAEILSRVFVQFS